MATQPIDDFCAKIKPSTKSAVGSASKETTAARKRIFEAAYPEAGKTDALRGIANAIKGQDLAANVRRAAESLERNGVKVLFAADAMEAKEQIAEIFKAEGVKNAVKVKSMTTEEIGLNSFLQSLGTDIVETDLGELIIQIEGEGPSHIVKPAMHRKRDDIAASFERHHVADSYDDNPQHITLNARKYLRKKFLAADAVITGANYVLAKEGSIALITNEGNARFSMAGAKIHIAIAGFEKVIPSAKELAVFLNLLARSATGQHSTVYTDFVSGPGSAKNSPQKMYFIFLDNGRSDILGSEFAEILKCMRCGACMNRCPVFRLISGHAYRATYPGPLGIVLSPLLAGERFCEYADLPKACTLCGACAEVCPAKIPLPDLVLKMRDLAKTKHCKVPNDINFAPFSFLATRPKLWRALVPLNRLANFLPLGAVKFGPLGRWLKTRTLPSFRGGLFRKWFKNG